MVSLKGNIDTFVKLVLIYLLKLIYLCNFRKMPSLLLFTLLTDFPSLVIGNISLLQKLFTKIPDYSFLKVFGCSCFPLVYNNHKLEFRSIECTFIGYSQNHKGHKCLAPSGRLFISKYVLFNEFSFHYQNQTFSASSHTSVSFIMPSTFPPIL